MEAVKYHEQDNFQKAIESFNKARQWPENPEVGRPFNVDERIEDFLEAKCWMKLGHKENALTLRKNIIQYSQHKGNLYTLSDYLYLLTLKQTSVNAPEDQVLKDWQ